MKYVLLIMILLVGCSVIEGDKPSFAKGAASALVEEKLTEDILAYEKNELAGNDINLVLAYERNIRDHKEIVDAWDGVHEDRPDLKEFRQIIAPCEAVASYLGRNDNPSRGEFEITRITAWATQVPMPTATPYPEGHSLANLFNTPDGLTSGSRSKQNMYKTPIPVKTVYERFLEPFVIEGLVEEYVGEGVWRVELKGNFLDIYEKHGDSSDFESYVWEVYEPLGNIRKISTGNKEYC